VYINKNEVTCDYINTEVNGNHVEESRVMRVVETRLQGHSLCHKFGRSTNEVQSAGTLMRTGGGLMGRDS
jgi:hypothetical protein